MPQQTRYLLDEANIHHAVAQKLIVMEVQT
jgi:hypothetical protein